MAFLTKDYVLQTFTSETGAQPIINVSTGHNVTYALRSGASDSVNVEVILKEGGQRTAAKTGIVGDVVDGLISGIAGIGINIVTNVSNDIQFEVLTSKRGG